MSESKKKMGFAAMTPCERSAAGKKGGTTTHARRHGHYFTSASARLAQQASLRVRRTKSKKFKN